MREAESLLEESKKVMDADDDAWLSSGDDAEIVGPVEGKRAQEQQ